MNPLRWFIARFLLLFSLVGLVLAQEDEGQLIVKNSKKFHQPVNSNDNKGNPLIQSSSLSFRNIDKWELSDFLLVGTVDGSLQARDRQTGLELWSIPGDRPLIKVTNNNNATDDKDDEDVTWIIEPLGDGVLYYFIPSTGLKQLPVSIKQLVLESPFAIHGDDKVYTGSRHTTLYSINATNGDVIKVYGEKLDGLGKSECKVPNKILEDDDGFDFDEDDDDDYLFAEQDAGSFMIGRTGMCVTNFSGFF
jgi:serine/threonine-protein kinase/endoribonuclease IRE1